MNRMPPGGRQCVIMNPGAGGADEDTLRAALQRLGDVTILVTDESRGLEQTARQALMDGFSRIVAAGGDGTLNGVVNGLSDDFARAELGLIPLGTGNDFARSVGVPAEIEGAIDNLLTGVARPIDVASVACEGSPPRYFVNASQAGFGGAVGEDLAENGKGIWGRLAYAISAVKSLPSLEAHRVRLTLDGESLPEFDVYNLIVANGACVAGGIPVAPCARPGDGWLDVLGFRAIPAAELALLVPQVLMGEHLNDDAVFAKRGRFMEVTSEPALSISVDGEPVGTSPARYQLHPGALRMVLPAAPD
jgi:diacylglycerol kinase (ATP)